MGVNRSKVWYDENQRKILVLSFCQEYSNGIFINFYNLNKNSK